MKKDYLHQIKLISHCIFFYFENALFLHLNSRLFFRERRSRERESQRNGRRVLGHGLNRDPSVPEGHSGIFPSSQT